MSLKTTLMMQHIAPFSIGDSGGNPAGVVLCESLPDPAEMQAVAAEAGYSESVFAAPAEGAWRARYFAPTFEVDFCGHATIALGAALARQSGPGVFDLVLNRANITVEGEWSPTHCAAAFRSPPTHSGGVSVGVLDEVLALFGLSHDQLDSRLPPAIANAGGDHLILALRDRAALRDMRYDFSAGRTLAEREGLVTFNLVHVETPSLFHARNPFPLGGVYEDPATGSAAAALAGYLRDRDWPHSGDIVILQGEDMGAHCRIEAAISLTRGDGVRVSGAARFLSAPAA